MYIASITDYLKDIKALLTTLVSRSTPYTLTFSDDDNTTLACSLVREHGDTLDLDTPVVLATGATVFVGDVIEFTATGEAGYDPVVTIGGAVVELDESGKYKMTVAGNVTAECTGEEE
jgi:hypothetical protein